MSLVDQISRLTSALGTELKKIRDRSTHTGSQPISSITGLQTTLDTKINGVGATTIRSLSQTEYDSLSVKDPNTIYLIKA